MNTLPRRCGLLAVSLLLASTLSATTATSLSSFGGIEEPAVIYYPGSNTFQSDSYTNITDLGGGTFQMLLRYNTSGTMWWDGDRTTSNTDRQRAEIKTLGPNQMIHQTFDYTTTWRVNSGFVASGGFCHITQLKPTDGVEGSSGAPLVTTSLKAGSSSALVQYASASFSAANVFSPQPVRNFSYSPGTFLAEKIRITPTADGETTGEVLVSLNGDAFQGVTNVEVCRPSSTTYYPKWGFYRKVTTTSGFGPNDYVQHSNVSANQVTSSTVATPTFSPGGGSYSSAQSVTISTATSGATIRYTTDGSTPTETNGTVYSGPVTISTTTTLQAVAYEAGYNDSTVASATYSIQVATYMISASAGTGGSISPSGTVSVAQGGSQTFSIAANSGYSISSVTVDGANVGAVTSYTFSNVQANHTISAAFAASGATTAINDTDAGISYSGTWSYSSNRNIGDYQNDVHYTKVVGNSFSYTFNGTGIDYVTETYSDEGNVTIYIDGVQQTTVSCYSTTRQVQQVVYSATGLASGSHTLQAVMASGTYMLIDELIVHTSPTVTYTITATAGAGGTISPSGSVSVNQGANQTFTIGANSGYSISDVSVDGASIGAVSSYTFGNVQANHTISASFSAITGGLPAGWNDVDVGSPALAGSASYASGTFTVNGCGSDIWGTSDQFNYAYQSTSGNTTITALVASQQNTATWAKSGVMFRGSTAANDVFVDAFVSPSNGIAMQYRTAVGGTCTSITGTAGVTAPYWVRIVRSGNTFTGYSSADGTTWTQIGSASISMASSATAGLEVCSHNTSALNTSTFQNVSVTPSSNLAPSGTAYGWFGMSSSTATTNQTAQPGLNDGNLTNNVDLDSAGDSVGAWEGAGVVWSSAHTVTSANFINGDITTGGDGFLTANLTLQFTTNGTTWTNSGWTVSPAYPYGSSAGGQTYTFSGTAVSGVVGARFVGQVRTTDTSYHWIVKEVQFIGN